MTFARFSKSVSLDGLDYLASIGGVISLLSISVFMFSSRAGVYFAFDFLLGPFPFQ